MPARVEKHKDRIWLKVPWSPGMPAKCKRIVGASFSKRNGNVWTYPLDMVICRDLRAAFGKNLIIGPELTKWAREQVRLERELTPLLTATDADLERVPKYAPLIWEAMNDDACMEPKCRGIGTKTHKPDHRVKSHRYQKPVIKYCATARRAQNASQPGLGKTLETLASIIEAGITGLVLVAAPKTSVRVVWEAEVQRWLPGTPVFACTGGKRRRLDAIDQAIRTWHSGEHNLVFVIVNPEMLRTHTQEECTKCDWSRRDHSRKNKEADAEHDALKHKVAKWYEHEYPALFEMTWSGFVIDETHRYILKVNLRTAKATLSGTGAMLIKLADDHIKLALSGTPWKGKPRNAWSVAHWLHGDQGLAASFWNWAFRMLQVEDGEYGKVIGGIGDEETFNKWVDGFVIRHTKAEMAPWLPPKTYAGARLDPKDPDSPIAIWLDMDGKQASAYKAMEEQAVVNLDSGTLSAVGVLAERTRLKQFASSYGDLKIKVVKGEEVKNFHPQLPSNKFDAMLEFLDERGITGDPKTEEGDSKVVIASQFTQVIHLWASEFRKRGIECYELTGDENDAKRMNNVRDFQSEDGHRVFLLNTMAGGVAVTLDAADDLFFIDETDVPDDQEQVEDRTHRTSKVHNVTIYYLKTRGTVDEHIARQNMSKDLIQKRLLDGKRGVEFARKLLTGG